MTACLFYIFQGPTKLTEMTANFEEGKYAIHVLSKVTEGNAHPLHCFAYLCKVTHDVTRISAFLEVKYPSTLPDSPWTKNLN